MNDLDKLLEQWRTGLQTPFSPDPANLIALGDQIVLANRIITGLNSRLSQIETAADAVLANSNAWIGSDKTGGIFKIVPQKDFDALAEARE